MCPASRGDWKPVRGKTAGLLSSGFKTQLRNRNTTRLMVIHKTTHFEFRNTSNRCSLLWSSETPHSRRNHIRCCSRRNPHVYCFELNNFISVPYPTLLCLTPRYDRWSNTVCTARASQIINSPSDVWCASRVRDRLHVIHFSLCRSEVIDRRQRLLTTFKR